MAESKTKKFEENFLFLESMAKELQEGTISVDELVPKMKQASQAMKVCKDVLKATRSQLIEIEKDFEDIFSEEDESASK